MVSRFSIETEFHTLALTVYKVLWIKRLLCELNFKLPSIPAIHCDNVSAGHLAKNHIQHVRAKHNKIDFYFIHQKITSNVLSVEYTPTKEQIIDAMNKALPTERF